jgi:membrane protein
MIFLRLRSRRAALPTLAAGSAMAIIASGSAGTPSEIPVRGWKDILLRVYENVGKDRVIVIAAGVTFYSLLAIFPAIAAVVAIYGLFADPSTIASQVNALSGVFPGGAIDVVHDQISRVAEQGAGKLGATFIVGLAVSLWSANAGIKSMFDALNLVYNETEKRRFLRLNLASLAFTSGAIVFALLAIGTTIVIPIALGYLGLGGATATLVEVLRWPVLLATVAIVIGLLYRYGPSRARPQWGWITWGGVFAAFAWLAVSLLFSWYAENFGSYNKIYGSLGAVIGFMMWIWLSIVVILMGAELDAEMEHQTARDTTTGRPKPLGARGATMADTVGAAQD